jgi:hypothetical protein
MQVDSLRWQNSSTEYSDSLTFLQTTFRNPAEPFTCCHGTRKEHPDHDYANQEAPHLDRFPGCEFMATA